MNLPDFSHALVTAVSFGPRQEFTLTLSLLEWEGGRGAYAPEPWHVRFGGVRNLDEARQFWKQPPVEIASLTKIGAKFVFELERTPGRLAVDCTSMSRIS